MVLDQGSRGQESGKLGLTRFLAFAKFAVVLALHHEASNAHLSPISPGSFGPSDRPILGDLVV